MEKFKNWLEIFMPNSVSQYFSGIEKINSILFEINKSSVEDLNISNIDDARKLLLDNQKFKDFNASNNIGTATLSNYKKFLETENIIPTLKDTDVKWGWTSGTPTNGYNSPYILCEVIKLFDNYKRGIELNSELKKLEKKVVERNKFSAEKSASLVLSQDRDVLTQFGQYWKFFSLTDSSSRDVKLTKFGKKIAIEQYTLDDFIEYQIQNITQNTIDGNVKSLLLILQLLEYIAKINPKSAYLKVDELANILPYVYLDIFSVKQLSNCILYYRLKPSLLIDAFSSKLTSNEVRFIEQHFLFLQFSEKLVLKTNSGNKQYYLNNPNPDFDIDLNEEINDLVLNFTDMKFNYKTFHQYTKDAGLIFTEKMVARFVASLCTKPFVICSGLSGSGKTKLAQSFVQWISESDQQYKIVPVGADWTNREPLLGYPNALKATEYISPDNGVLDLILQASNNKNLPYFLILDEMNLSHVERYFADFLSTMESKDAIPLHADNLDGVSTRQDSKGDIIPNKINLPSNLFIIGTVNIDETTYMFSPKVLDRANAIEFRITDKEIENYLDNPGILDMKKFVDQVSKKGFGASMASNFLNLAEELATSKKASTALVIFFKELKKAGAEFGYRSASEINRLVAILESLTKEDRLWDNEKVNDNDFIDIAIMQKLLPKLHGSRSKLCPILLTLAKFCILGGINDFDKKDDDFRKTYFKDFEDIDSDKKELIIYPISFEKIARMHKNAIDNGFTSYAEA